MYDGKKIKGRNMRTFFEYWKNIFNYKGQSNKKEFVIIIVANIIIAILLGALGGVLSEVFSNKLFIRLPNVYSLLSVWLTIAMLKRIINSYRK